MRFLLMALMVAFVAVGCGDDAPVFPPNPNPPGPGGGGGQGGGTQEYPLISTEPAFVTESMTEDVKVIVNGAGTAIDGFTGELYAHTGVITDKSTSTSDWKYVKSEWGVNIDDCKLKSLGNNLWELLIAGGPRAYYGVPESESIEMMAFVFRSADSTVELKDNGQDIFVELSKEGMQVMFLTPKDGIILQVGDSCEVQVKQQEATSVTLYKNDEQVATTSETTLNYTFEAMVAEDVLFKAVATDGSQSVEKSISIAVLGATEQATRPAGAEDGVTVEGADATFVLYAPGKQSVVLLGEFNDYKPSNDYLMKRDGDYFWTTVEGLESGVEYGYQYLVNGEVRVGDPYSEKILDPWNDKWIDASVYPNLKAYPAEYTTDVVSVFSYGEAEYQWQVSDFDRPAENSLAIYELLVRDFTTERSIDAVTAKLDYLDELGINAIELMPIQEFDGNDSWGYNPCFFFAADKAYGTKDAYKRFIDECHKRGIAVILDVVFNHATGQFPYAKMWWNAGSNCTAADNPFFNVTATHNFSVFHDFNHLYPKTRSYFRDVLQFWLEEYNVDGFRFDLTKGFVQNPSNYDASGYSAERIGILSDYANAIREVEPDAYIIFEHFCDQSEEDELYEKVGGLCWNNGAMGGYGESVMGWYDDGSIDGFWGLMGDFQNNNWSNDIAFVQKDGYFVAEDVIFADANKEGCAFKVRKNRNWDTSYGVASASTRYNLGVEIALTGTANVTMNATAGVKYDFYFNPETMKIYVMEDGAKPAQAKLQSVTRAGNQSNFSGYKRGRINNIETHDEERIAYKAITHGQTWVMGDWSAISKRLQAVYAFHFLLPYPRMMWQFGELGYDFSINMNEDGVLGTGDEYRTHRKPIRWDYYDNADRRAIYDALSKIISWRTSHEEIYAEDNVKVHTLNVSDSHMSGKTLVMDNVIVVANFTAAASTTKVNVPAAGQWQNLLTGQSVTLSSEHSVDLEPHDYVIYVR